jgi:hypothetical protein
MKKTMLRLTCTAWIVLTPLLAPAAELPSGWIKAGSEPSQYDMGVDKTVRRGGHAVAFVKGTAERFNGFGTLMQMASPGDFRGKRVRFSADVKSDDVKSGWGGLWFRVDGARPSDMLGFDNMMDRPLKGTTEWKRVEIVLDVPDKATGLAFGLLLDGDGEVWMGDLNFEVVSLDVPVTGVAVGTRTGPPRNLDFEK